MSVEEGYDIETPEGVGNGSEPVGHRPPSSTARVVIGLLLVLLVAGAVVYRGVITRVRAAAEVKADTQNLAVPSVSLAKPKRSAPQEEIELPGNIQAFIDAPIYARTNGYLKRWYVDIGGRVKKDQLLAEIDTPELDQQLQAARADLATAKANFALAQITANRYQSLLKTDSVAKQDVDNAVGNEQSKQAMVDSAVDNVKRLEQLQSFEKVYAPFDGVLTARNTDIGQLIASGNAPGAKELFHVAAISTLRVYVSVPQIYSPVATPGVQAYLTLPQFPGRRFPGKLVRNAEAIDQSSRTLLTEVDVPEPHRRDSARGLHGGSLQAALRSLDGDHPGDLSDLSHRGLACGRGTQRPRGHGPDLHGPRLRHRSGSGGRAGRKREGHYQPARFPRGRGRSADRQSRGGLVGRRVRKAAVKGSGQWRVVSG